MMIHFNNSSVSYQIVTGTKLCAFRSRFSHGQKESVQYYYCQNHQGTVTTPHAILFWILNHVYLHLQICFFILYVHVFCCLCCKPFSKLHLELCKVRMHICCIRSQWFWESKGRQTSKLRLQYGFFFKHK